jgi:hypothetical protein
MALASGIRAEDRGPRQAGKAMTMVPAGKATITVAVGVLAARAMVAMATERDPVRRLITV